MEATSSEDFQDLGAWCQPAGDLNTPVMIDGQKAFNYIEGKRRNKKRTDDEVAGLCWEDFGLKMPNEDLEMESNNTHTYNMNNPYSPNVMQGDNQAYSMHLGSSEDSITLGEYIVDPNNYLVKCEDTEMSNSSFPIKSINNDVMLSSGNIHVCEPVQTITQSKGSKPTMPAGNINYDLTLSSDNIRKNNDMIISQIIFEGAQSNVNNNFIIKPAAVSNVSAGKKDLKLDVKTGGFCGLPDLMVTTPDVLRTVELLENEHKYDMFRSDTYNHLVTPSVVSIEEKSPVQSTSRPPSRYLTPPDTPKSVATKRSRHDSEDSDESYVPSPSYRSKPKRSKKARHDEMMELLNTPVRRGRPPKHRDSISSTSTAIDDNASIEDIYRVRRDKNNEASKRSRYNKKKKDQDMVSAADNLEAKNEKLKVLIEKLTKQTQVLREGLFRLHTSGKT